MNHLEVTSADDIEHVESLVDPRIWVGHFHSVDFIISSNEQLQANFDGIDFKSKTKFRESDTGRSSLTSPPRPAATKHSILQSIFCDCRSISFADYSNQAADVTIRKRKKKNNSESAEDKSRTPMSSIAYGRPIATPFFEFYIGVAENLINLMKIVNNHGQKCKGGLHFRRSEVTTRRLALSVRCTCSMGTLCKTFLLGVFKWQSTPDIPITPTRSVPVPDVLYALAVCMTPITMAHADQLFSAMLLTPPSRNLLKDIINLVVDPYLVNEKARLVTDACREIRDSGLSPVLCMDVGHSSARNSQAATLAAASGNVLLFTMTDTKTNAWLKETALVGRALDYAITEEKLDVCMVEIDDNAKNATIITSYTRVNGPEESKNEIVKAGIDVFHAAKAMGKHLVKVTAENSIVIGKFFKPLCDQNCAVSGIIARMCDMMTAKSDDFFSDIMKTFSNHGASTWRSVSRTPTEMREFAVSNNLVDRTSDFPTWEPLVTAWNTIFSGKGSISSVAKIKITMSLSSKTLRILAQSVEIVTGNKFVLDNKGNEKTELYMYMKKYLPDICYRGHNFSCDLYTTTQDVLREQLESDISATTSHIDPDEVLMSELFGNKARTLREVRKLNTEKLTVLARHLAHKIGEPAPDKSSKMKPYCVLNLWRLNNLWEDVNQAMGIGQRAFIARLGEFKRTMKNLLRVVNDQFGGWSLKFRMCFLINGLLNFVNHFSDNHIDCARYFWWTQCGDSHVKYVPTQEYCTVISSGRGAACRDLIPAFFRLFVYSFVFSKYAETQFWKCLSFSKTTICESYFHWKSIMIPKWQNIPPREYERKERAAFIAFVRRQKEKVFLLKKLVTSKYANTLTVASGQKNSRYEQHILEALKECCGDIPAVLAAVDHFTRKCTTRQNRRHNLLNTVTTQYEADETAMNLNLGPVKHELRTEDKFGGPNTQSFSELSTSARPVAPFPFKIEALLDDDQKYRLENVWASSRALKKNRCENDLDSRNLDDCTDLCTLCELRLNSDKKKCLICSIQVHTECLENYNSEWEINCAGESVCKQCSTVDRLAFADDSILSP